MRFPKRLEEQVKGDRDNADKSGVLDVIGSIARKQKNSRMKLTNETINSMKKRPY